MKLFYSLSIGIVLFLSPKLYGQNESKFNANYSQGEELFDQGKFLSAIKKYQAALLFTADTSQIKRLKTYYRIGNSHQLSTSLDSASFYYKKTDQLYNDKLPADLKSEYYHNKASINYAYGRTDSAMHYGIKALDLAKESNNLILKSLTFSSLGDMFLKNNVFVKAEEYYNNSLDIAIASQDSIAIAEVTQRIGQLKFAQKDYKAAETELTKALSIYESEQNMLGILTTQTYLSKVYFFNGNMEKAAQIGFKLIPLMNQIEFAGKAKELVKNTNRILELPKQDSLNVESLKEAKELVNKNIELTTIPEVNIEQKKGLIKFFEEERKQIKDSNLIVYDNNSLEIRLQEILTQKDSLYQASLKSQFNELETKYRTEQKEKELAEQKIANQQQLLLTQKATTEKWFYLGVLLISILTFVIIATYFLYKRRKQKVLNQLNILKAKQYEQNNLGKELHDRSSKDLEAVVIALSKNGNKKLAAQVSEIKSEIRNLSHELSHIDFTESTFVDQMINLAATYHAYNLAVEIIGLNLVKWKKIKDPIKHHLLFIIREAISNAYLHACASKIDIQFEMELKTLFIYIKDDGNGFEANKKTGQGLRNLKSRVKDIGGKLSINSEKQNGTCVNLSVNVY